MPESHGNPGQQIQDMATRMFQQYKKVGILPIRIV